MRRDGQVGVDEALPWLVGFVALGFGGREADGEVC